MTDNTFISCIHPLQVAKFLPTLEKYLEESWVGYTAEVVSFLPIKTDIDA